MALTFSFGPQTGRHIESFGSDFDISRILHSDQIHISCMRLQPGGLVGLHRTASPQLLAVVEGSGWIHGDQGPRTAVAAGTAVFWEQGEMHETGTDTGLVALVIESDLLREGVGRGPA